MKDKFHPDEFESRTLPFEVNRLSPTIGGELLGVDLREDLTSEIKELIYEALLVYKVIFFRDQDLTTDQHIHFSKNFGANATHASTIASFSSGDSGMMTLIFPIGVIVLSK